MNGSYVDDYIDKLNITPSIVNEKLRMIRKLDQKVLSLQIQIEKKRQESLEKLKQYEEKKNNRLKAEIEDMLKDINQIHKHMISLSKEKMELAEKVYNAIDDPTEYLDHYLTANPAPEDPNSPIGRKNNKSKRGKKENDWEEDLAEPHYCYCRRPSFGVMVMCDAPFCETEWFHTDCLDERNPNEKQKWYCRDCRKNKPKVRAAR